MELEGTKAELHRYLQVGREALVWKLEGLSEYDIRRPMTPTGTNLLGIVKHVASVEAGYLGEIMGRPFDEPLPWSDDDAEPNADMWATADETREDIVGLYRRVWAQQRRHDRGARSRRDRRGAVVAGGHNEVTLHRLLIHMIAETHRHAGHADVVRETSTVLQVCGATTPTFRRRRRWWADYRARVESAARAAR